MGTAEARGVVDPDAHVRPGASSEAYGGSSTGLFAKGAVEPDALTRPGPASRAYGDAAAGLFSKGATDLDRFTRPGAASLAYGNVADAPLFATAIVTTGGTPLMPILSSSTPIAAGETVYLGKFGFAVEGLVAIPLPACNVVELNITAIQADGAAGAPGAGQTFTYTCRLIAAGATAGSDETLLQGAIAGASDFELRLADATGVPFANGDRLSCKLVTSAGAAAVEHVVSAKLSFA